MSHAALYQWQIESIGFYQTISIAKNSQELFEEMKDLIISDMNLLIDEHYEDINCSDLEGLYEAFVGDDFPGEDWCAEDVRDLLTELIQEQSVYLKGFPESPTMLGKWYDLIVWLNEFWDVYYADYLSIPVEGPLVNFVPGLIEFFGQPIPGQRIIEFEEGRWIIHLKHIMNTDTWWDKPEMLREVRRLFYEFNERHE
jgi:hypothetical protein